MILVLRTGPQVLLCVALAAGGVSLVRIGDAFINVGLLGEFRFVAILVVALLGGIASLARREPSALNRGVLYWLLLVIALHLMVLSSFLWGTPSEFAWQQFYELLLLITALVLTAQLFRNDPEHGLTLLLVVFVGIASLFTIAAIVKSGNLRGELPILGAGGIGAGRILGMGVIGLLFAYLRRGHIVFLLPIPGFVAGILLSGSRAAALALAISVVAIVLLEARLLKRFWIKRNRASIFKGLGFSALLVIGFFATSYGREVAVNFALASFVSSAQDNAPVDIYLASRDVIFIDAWQQFSRSMYGGLGLGVYRGPFGELYPHNILLGFAVDAGFLGLVGVVVSTLWGMVVLVRARTPAANVAAGGALFFLVASLFAGSYYDARFMWIFMLLGLICIYKQPMPETQMLANAGEKIAVAATPGGGSANRISFSRARVGAETAGTTR